MAAKGLLWLRVASYSLMVGTSWQEKHEEVGHIVSIIRKSKMMKARAQLTFFFSSSSGS